MLSDIRESGSIEQDADIVMFLYREEYYKDQSDAKTLEQEANTAEVIIAKNRHGAQGTVKMGWIGQFTKFRTLDEESGGPPA
jgi:replicative DNA helicase